MSKHGNNTQEAAPLIVSTMTAAYLNIEAGAEQAEAITRSVMADEQDAVKAIMAMRHGTEERNRIALWTYHFIERRVFALLTGVDGETFKTKDAWIRDRFKVDTVGEVKSVSNHFDYLRRIGAEIVGAVEGKGKGAAADVDASVAKYIASKLAKLSPAGKLGAFRALLPGWAEVTDVVGMSDVLTTMVKQYDEKRRVFEALAPVLVVDGAEQRAA